MQETKRDVKLIKALVDSGSTYDQIADALGVSLATAQKYCKEMGLTDRVKRQVSRGGHNLRKILEELYPTMTIKSEFHVGERLRLDFYIPSYSLGFEYDGVQHFEDTWLGDSKDHKKRDKIKTELCKENHIALVRIAHHEELTKDLVMVRCREALNALHEHLEQYPEPKKVDTKKAWLKQKRKELRQVAKLRYARRVKNASVW